jgi:hypothetical protein
VCVRGVVGGGGGGGCSSSLGYIESNYCMCIDMYNIEGHSKKFLSCSKLVDEFCFTAV